MVGGVYSADVVEAAAARRSRREDQLLDSFMVDDVMKCNCLPLN